jgi:hypothetical protein
VLKANDSPQITQVRVSSNACRAIRVALAHSVEQCGFRAFCDARTSNGFPQPPQATVTLGADLGRRGMLALIHVDRQLREQKRRLRKAYAWNAWAHCSQVH